MILITIGDACHRKCYLSCNSLIQKMCNGSSFRLAIERTNGEVTIEVPIYIDELIDGHVFVLQQIHGIQFDCDYLRSIHRVTPKVTFLCTYLNTVDPSLFPVQTNIQTISEQIVHEQQMETYVLNDLDNLSCTLKPKFIQFSMGIYFLIFDSMGRPVYDTKLLSSVCLNFRNMDHNYEVLNIEDPKTILGSSAQFPQCVDKFEDERIREISQTRVDTLQSRPVVFPVEVWDRIFYYTTSECIVSLMSSCKFLFKTSRQPSILPFLYRRFNYLKGWYCLPFNDNKIYDYALNNCINFNWLNEIILRLTFSRRIPPEYTVCISTITRNIVRRTFTPFFKRRSSNIITTVTNNEWNERNGL